MKTLKRLLRLLVGLGLVLGLGLPALAAAQGVQPNIHIHDVVGPDVIRDPNGLDALRVTLDFTLLNDSGEVIPGVALTSATLDLDDGSHNPSPITEINTQWSVALLVDSSRTLALAAADPAYKAAREDAIAAVGAMPDGTNLTVLSVNDKVEILEDFTAEKEKIQTSLLREWKPANVAVSCLYDGAVQAVSNLSRAPGRRALIILTASANSCASLAQDVVTLAEQNGVQIYGVGIRGFAAVPAELEALAQPTGGLVDVRDAADVNFAFQNITNALNLQRRATATFYPLAGPQNGTLTLVLPDNSVIKSDPIPFVSPRDFEQLPELTIQGEVIFDDRILTVNLGLTSPALVQTMEASIIDVATETPVAERVRVDLTSGLVQIPVPDLPVGGKFRLEIRAFSAEQVQLAQAAKEFTVVAVVPLLLVTNVTPPALDDEDPAYVLTLQRENLEGLVKYRIRMLPNGAQVTVPGSEQVVPAGITVRVPLPSNLATGIYVFEVQPLAEDDTVLAPPALSQQFQFTALDPRAEFFRKLREDPLAITGISVATALGCIGFLVVIFFVVSAARPKQARLPKVVDLALPDVKRRAPPPVMDSGAMRGPPSAGEMPAARPSAPRRPAVAERAPARPREDRSAAPAAAAVGQSVPKACLTSHTPPELRLTGRITKTPYTVGRATGNDLVVQVDNRVGVSSKHASIVYDKGRFFIIDQKSTYGTTLNNQKVAPNTPTPLEEGVLIGLGPKIVLKFSQQDCA